MAKLYLIVYVAGEIYAAIAMPRGMNAQTCEGAGSMATMMLLTPLLQSQQVDSRAITVRCEFKTQPRN